MVAIPFLFLFFFCSYIFMSIVYNLLSDIDERKNHMEFIKEILFLLIIFWFIYLAFGEVFLLIFLINHLIIRIIQIIYIIIKNSKE